jgi:cellulose synthase/poly-beta-1,6-N-acetylglucosamine synthase-like glycosyltransferase
MVTFLSYLFAICAGLLAIPVLVLFLEVAAAITLPRQRLVRSANDVRNRVAVLIPAHNESVGLLPTLEDVKAQLRHGDRLLVIADNCIDDTAAVARAAGAEVVERHDVARVGKGYALDFSLRHLSTDPPDVVIIIDADCRLADGTIDRLSTTCATTGRPVQALDLMIAPEGSRINYRVVEFAWRVKNWVRPLGLSALNLPCQLMGTGMAFPWEVIRSANLANGSIVEDLKLGLDLTLAGNPPLFCPSAKVTSQFPESVEAASTQRARWEQGHVGLILSAAPRLIWTAVARGRFDLLILTLDVAVPPLSLLGILVVGMFALAGLSVLFGFSSAALTISTASLLVLMSAIFLSWLMYGRDILSTAAIFSIPSYVFGKIPLYHHMLSGRMVERWIRTERPKSPSSNASDAHRISRNEPDSPV